MKSTLINSGTFFEVADYCEAIRINNQIYHRDRSAIAASDPKFPTVDNV